MRRQSNSGDGCCAFSLDALVTSVVLFATQPCRLLAYLVKLMMLPFFDVEIIGRENLDQKAVPAAVMVSNHQSAVDSLIFGYLWDHNFRVRAVMAPAAPRSLSEWNAGRPPR